MAKRDLEELFSMVKVGDEVEIRGERDAADRRDLRSARTGSQPQTW